MKNELKSDELTESQIDLEKMKLHSEKLKLLDSCKLEESRESMTEKYAQRMHSLKYDGMCYNSMVVKKEELKREDLEIDLWWVYSEFANSVSILPEDKILYEDLPRISERANTRSALPEEEIWRIVETAVGRPVSKDFLWWENENMRWGRVMDAWVELRGNIHVACAVCALLGEESMPRMFHEDLCYLGFGVKFQKERCGICGKEFSNAMDECTHIGSEKAYHVLHGCELQHLSLARERRV